MKQVFQKKKIAIFASGAGSNAKKIIEYFNSKLTAKNKIEVALVVSNNADAGVLKIAKRNNISVLLIEKEKFFSHNSYINELKNADMDLIVLAGFLWKIPANLIKAFPEKIINIHPALLPHFGGKGMYGNRVHQAVLASGEKESGITIHVVDELYDHGKIIFQISCPVFPDDTQGTLAERIHKLEHKHYAKVIEDYLIDNN